MGAPVALCFLLRDGAMGREVLLGRKKRGFGRGKIVGLGGHLEAGETPAEAAARELFVHANTVRYRMHRIEERPVVRGEPPRGAPARPWTRPSPARPPRGSQPSTVAKRLPDEEEVWGGLVLATRDYVRKNGFRSVLLGVSGGIDSTVVATLAADRYAAARLTDNYYDKYIRAAQDGGMAAVCELDHFKERIEARPQNRAALMAMDAKTFIAAMERCGADRGRVAVALGPTIRQPNYEVGPEFVASFKAEDGANERFFRASSRYATPPPSATTCWTSSTPTSTTCGAWPPTRTASSARSSPARSPPARSTRTTMSSPSMTSPHGRRCTF